MKENKDIYNPITRLTTWRRAGVAVTTLSANCVLFVKDDRRVLVLSSTNGDGTFALQIMRSPHEFINDSGTYLADRSQKEVVIKLKQFFLIVEQCDLNALRHMEESKKNKDALFLAKIIYCFNIYDCPLCDVFEILEDDRAFQIIRDALRHHVTNNMQFEDVIVSVFKFRKEIKKMANVLRAYESCDRRIIEAVLSAKTAEQQDRILLSKNWGITII